MPEKKDPSSEGSKEPEHDYDLKASTKKIGQLYPVLRAADGEILDGVHRMESDPAWKTLVLENITTPEDKVIARLIANFHRRTVATEEKAEWINQLAEIYRNNGLKIEGARNRAQGPNEIARKICEATGIGYRTVMEYLVSCFKQHGHRRLDPEQHQAYKEPEEIIFNHLKGGKAPTWAREVIERFKEEYTEQLLKSPLFRKKVLDMIPKKISNPMRPATVFNPSKPEQVEELMRLKEQDVFPEQPEQKHRTSVGPLYRHRQKREDPHEGYEPVGPLYPVFHEECPDCLCEKCKHADMCIERVRPED